MCPGKNSLVITEELFSIIGKELKIQQISNSAESSFLRFMEISSLVNIIYL